MILIERWLNGSQNFIVEKILFNRFGDDDALKALFAKGETPFAKQVVAQPELSVYMQMPKATDAVLKAIENEWKPKYQRMNFLRHKLDGFIHANDPIAQSKCKETLFRS